MVVWLGWFNVSLVAFNLLPYLSRRINRLCYQNQNKSLRSVSRVLNKIHPYTGVVFLITAFTHGYMALGAIRLHTGYIAFFSGVLLFLVALTGKRFRIKGWIKFHRGLALLLAAAILVHIFARNII